jgi:hypothetical protein
VGLAHVEEERGVRQQVVGLLVERDGGVVVAALVGLEAGVDEGAGPRLGVLT